MSDSTGIESDDLLTAEDIENEALRQERDWYLTEDGFIDFTRDSGAAPDAQFEPHGRYAPSILQWNGELDPESDRVIYKYKLVLWPRGSFKSTVFDVAYVCWLIANNPNIRILVASETGKQARKFVDQAMLLIDSEWFKERFGTHRGSKWKSGQFYSALRTAKHMKEPTLQATGVGEVQTGAHWDMVIMDDVVSQENTKTPEAIENLWHWFGETLAQLDPGCKLLVIGTLHHYADIYCKIQSTPEMLALFETSIHSWRNPDGSLFFPGRLTARYVENQKALMPPRLHACFYDNRPHAEGQQLFKEDYFRVVEDHEIPSSVWTYILTDWAFVTDEKKKGRPDQTCFWVISLDCNRVAYVRDFYVGRWKPHESVLLACKLWDDGMKMGWNMKGMCVEKTTHAELLSTVFDLVKRETFIRPKMILIGGRSQEIKEMRIEASEPRWRRGDIYFARSVREAFEQKWRPMTRGMTEWPFSAHDDIPDAQSDLDKVDEGGKVYCPGPPAGWRAPNDFRPEPSMIDGALNPDYGYPARSMSRMEQRQEGQTDLWLGRSSSTDAPQSHQGQEIRESLFQGQPQRSPSIFHKPSSARTQSGRLW